MQDISIYPFLQQAAGAVLVRKLGVREREMERWRLPWPSINA